MNDHGADVSTSLEAFARLCARLAHPFADRAVILSSMDLTQTAFEAAKESWAERLRKDAQQADAFARVYAFEVGGTSSLPTQTAGAPKPTPPAAGLDPDQTAMAPLAAILPTPLPFEKGEYRPAPIPTTPRPARSFDPDVTSPPVASPDETMPFLPIPADLLKKKD